MPSSPSRLPTFLAISWLLLVSVIVLLADRGLLYPVYQYIRLHPGSDKLGHFFLIGISAGLLHLALPHRKLSFLPFSPPLAPLLIALLATLEESSQIFLPTRSFDLLDLTADYAGILFFTSLSSLLLSPKKPSP